MRSGNVVSEAITRREVFGRSASRSRMNRRWFLPRKIDMFKIDIVAERTTLSAFA
jgi:hypothetical protein